LASYAKKQKVEMYRLKEKGIISAHKSGLFRYVGASPQGMAVTFKTFIQPTSGVAGNSPKEG
jgi:hypothetical protein